MKEENKIIITGWFSHEVATFGDTQAMELVANWLSSNGYDFDISASKRSRVNGVPLDQIDFKDYDTLIYVCGPWLGKNIQFRRLGENFMHHKNRITKIGVDLSVRDNNHGFDMLLPRDFFDIKNPDLVFGVENSESIPVVGLFMVHGQGEYGKLQRHKLVKQCIEEYFKQTDCHVIDLCTHDTHDKISKFNNIQELESIIRKCDYIITTRMHGLVYSLKNNIPVLAIDCIAGGAKVTAQAEAVGWPAILNGDGITVEDIETGVKTAIDNKDKIKQLNIDAVKKISEIKKQLINYLSQDSQNDDKR
jgi:hypothetical protein